MPYSRIVIVFLLFVSPHHALGTSYADPNPLPRTNGGAVEDFVWAAAHSSKAIRRIALAIYPSTESSDAQRRIAQAAIGLLRGKDADLHFQATFRFGDDRSSRPTPSRFVVREIAALLDQSDFKEKNALTEALIGAGRDAAPAVPTLVRLLDDRYIRLSAIRVLEAIGPPAAAALPALLRIAGEGESIHRWSALTALGAIGKDRSDVRAALLAALERDEDRARAIIGLRHAAPGSQELAARLLPILDDPRYVSLVLETMRPLKLLGEIPEERFIRFLPSLASHDPCGILKGYVAGKGGGSKLVLSLLTGPSAPKNTSGWDAHCFHDLVREQRVEAGVLVPLLQDSNPALRSIAVSRLSESGPVRQHLPEFVRLLDDPDGSIRAQAASILARLGKTGMSELVSALRSPVPRVRAAAVRAFYQNRTPDQAVDTLAILLSDENRDVRFLAAAALTTARRRPGAALGRAFRAADADSRQTIAWAILAPGGRADDALPELRPMLSEDRPDSRHAAAVVIAALDPGEETVWPHVLDALSAPGWVGEKALELLKSRLDRDTLRRELAKAVENGGYAVIEAEDALYPPVPRMIPALVERLRSPRDDIRRHSALKLGQLGRKAAVAVPALRHALSDQDRLVRLSAAKALSDIGPAAKEALPELIAVLEQEDLVRAVLALRRIDEAAATRFAEDWVNCKSEPNIVTELHVDQEPRWAIIDGDSYLEGQAVRGSVLVTVSASSVTLRCGEKYFTVPLSR